MTLVEFTAMVKDEANKGDRLDAAIPTRISMAVQRLERRYTMKYMERFTTITIPSGDSSYTLLAAVKSIEFLRYYSDGLGDFVKLPQVDPTDVLGDSQRNPEGFWIDGVTTLRFDNTVQEDLDLQFCRTEYSSLPLDDASWILANATDCLLAETMIVLSTRAREPSWKDKYGDMLQTSMADLFRADNELRNTARDYTMQPPPMDLGSRYYNRYPGDDG